MITKKRQSKSKKVRAAAKEIHSAEPSTLGGRVFSNSPQRPAGRLDSESAGQSGDIQGLSTREAVDSESVQELLEEGQSHEAEVVSGVEDALDPDQGEVRTHRRRSLAS